MTTTTKEQLLLRAKELLTELQSGIGVVNAQERIEQWLYDVTYPDLWLAPAKAFTAEEIWLVERMSQTISAKQAGAVAELTTIATKMREERSLNLDVIAKALKYDRLHSPEIDNFLRAVENEALYQRELWQNDHDAGKAHADWFWLLGYLAGKALHDVKGKRLHHIITAAASLLNWHAYATGAFTGMRPGIEEPQG